jgi:hypothetical protein
MPNAPLKSFFSPAVVQKLAADIARVHPAFASRPFIEEATAGLEKLELLDRGKHISRVLATYLPAKYPQAIDVLLRSLGWLPKIPAGQTWSQVGAS